MRVRERSDPRLEGLFGLEPDPEGGVRPVVPLGRKGVPGWIFVALAVGAGFLLFVVLEARRAAVPLQVERTRPSSVTSQPPPDLILPPTAPTQFEPSWAEPSPASRVVAPAVVSSPVVVRPMPDVVSVRQPTYVPDAPAAPPGPSRGASSGALVVDYSGTSAPSQAEEASRARGGFAPIGGVPRSGGRVQSSALANRANTVAQGTVIPAVLETAFNSSQPGFARAIVSRNLRSFDGSKILIPRGSRLVGEYSANVGPGQNRAVIMWTRLIRPDGATIALNSPAVDPLGRGGVRAKVNSHLFERFTGGLFESIFSLGSNLAAGATNRGVVVALPGGTGASVASSGKEIVPTLSVPAGKSISVFVVHDLEFSEEGARP